MPGQSSKSSLGKPPLHPDGTGAQRIDKWLWFARIAKSRTLAAEFVQAGRVRVNRTKTDKPSATVKAGDVVTIAVRGRVRILKVASPGTRRGPAIEAQQLYEELTPPPPTSEMGSAANGVSNERSAHADAGSQPVAKREPGRGRPTKRERRAIERFRNDAND